MPNYRRRKEISEQRRKMALRRWALARERRAANPPPQDFADGIARGKEDRRGQIWRRWIVEDGAGQRLAEMVLRFSLRGRTDQLDLEVNGRPVGEPMGITRALAAFRRRGLEVLRAA